MAGSSTLPPEDQQLIAEARKLPYGHIHSEKAKTEEARYILEDIAHRQYRREERDARME